jgi:phage terminase large subunit-like protein
MAARLDKKQQLQQLINELETQFELKKDGDRCPPISLCDFFRESWAVLEPATDLVWNWHMEAVCFHIESIFLDWLKHRYDPAYIQRARNLIVTVPPGSAKSRVTSVCAPAWIWTYYPGFKMIFLSANPRVAMRDSVYCRDLIESEWYQNTFKPDWQLRDDQNSKSIYWNTAGGIRSAAGFNSRITGDRADLIAWDDPHDASEVNSDAIRMGVLERWDSAIRNRVNNPKSSIRIGIMQRLHAKDLAGHVLATKEWDHLCIPQEFERPRNPTAFGWVDPRTKPGELMFPERFPEEVLQAERLALGDSYSGQHQQNPTASGGGIFKIGKWMIYTRLPSITRWLLSVDATFKKSANSDFVSINALAQQANVVEVETAPKVDPRTGESIPQKKWLHNYYIPGIWHARAGITETQNAIKMMRSQFSQAGTILIEDKANGSAIIEQLGKTIPGITTFNPGGDSKTSRAWSIQPVHDRGGLFLPAADWAIAQIEALGKTEISLEEWWELYPPPHKDTAEHAPLADWAKGIVDEFTVFPNGANDDQVDSIDQGVIWCEMFPPPPPRGIKRSGIQLY